MDFGYTPTKELDELLNQKENELKEVQTLKIQHLSSQMRQRTRGSRRSRPSS